MDPNRFQTGSNMEPQYSIDKYSIDKYSIDTPSTPVDIAKIRKSLNRHQSSPVVTTGNQENIIKEKIIKENNYNTPSTSIDSDQLFNYKKIKKI